MWQARLFYKGLSVKYNAQGRDLNNYNQTIQHNHKGIPYKGIR